MSARKATIGISGYQYDGVCLVKSAPSTRKMQIEIEQNKQEIAELRSVIEVLQNQVQELVSKGVVNDV